MQYSVTVVTLPPAPLHRNSSPRTYVERKKSREVSASKFNFSRCGFLRSTIQRIYSRSPRRIRRNARDFYIPALKPPKNSSWNSKVNTRNSHSDIKSFMTRFQSLEVLSSILTNFSFRFLRKIVCVKKMCNL